MYHVFNMGVGLAFVLEPEEDVETVLDLVPDTLFLGQVTDQKDCYLMTQTKKRVGISSGTGSQFSSPGRDDRLKEV